MPMRSLKRKISKHTVAEMIRQYSERYENPIINAANNIYAEDVIEPAETRRILIRTFTFLRTKTRDIGVVKKHGKFPCEIKLRQ